VVQFCGKQNAQITFRAQTSQHQRCRILNDKFRQMQICLLCNHPKNQYQSGTTFVTAQFWHLAALNVNNYTFYQFPCHRWHLVIDTSESYRWNSSVKIWTGAGWYSTANGKQVPCTIKSTTGLLSSTGTDMAMACTDHLSLSPVDRNNRFFDVLDVHYTNQS